MKMRGAAAGVDFAVPAAVLGMGGNFSTFAPSAVVFSFARLRGPREGNAKCGGQLVPPCGIISSESCSYGNYFSDWRLVRNRT